MDKDKAEFDAHAESYDESLRRILPKSQAEDTWFAEYKVALTKARTKQEPARILDFGCGVGRSLPLLSAYFPNAELWGYDVSEVSLSMAALRAANTHLTSKVETLATGNFDLVIAANVFHHIPLDERVAALQLCARILKPNCGRLFLFEHNPLNPATRWVFERCEFDRGASMLSRRECLALGDAAGLQRIRSDYTLFFPKQLALFRPLEQWMGWIPLGAQYCLEFSKQTEAECLK